MAWRHLRRLGYTLLRKNYSLEHVGEIDIIARDGGTLCFIEVKTRQIQQGHRPAEAINAAKRKRIAKCAKYFLKKNSLEHVAFRYDIVEVELGKFFWQHQITLIAHAFSGSK